MINVLRIVLAASAAFAICENGRCEPISANVLNPSAGVIVVLPQNLTDASCVLLGKASFRDDMLKAELRRPRSVGDWIDIRSRVVDRVGYFDLNSVPNGNEYAVIRLRFTVVADRDKRCAVVLDGRRWYVFVCNGDSSPVYGSRKWIEKYGRVVQVQLHKGKNAVELRSIGRRGECTVSIGICDLVTARRVIRQNWLSDTDDLLALGSSPSDTTVGDEGRHSIPRDTTAGGAGQVISRDELSRLLERLSSLAKSVTDRAEADLISKRARFLMETSNRRIEKDMGDRDFREIVTEIKRMISVRRSSPNCDWIAARGRHFGAYGASPFQRYQCYVPSDIRRNPRPLVIVYPSSSASRPEFYNSYIVDLRDLNQSYINAAAELGAVVVWPSGRNIEHSSFVEGDILQCIDNVCRRFDCDPAKVMVIGACGAGRDALVFAAKHRDVCLVAAAHEVILSRHNASAAARNGDLSPQSPLDYAAELAKVNVFLSNGVLDAHVPVQNTVVLGRAITAAGGSPLLDLIEGADESYFPRVNNQWIDDAFKMFAGAIRRNGFKGAPHASNAGRSNIAQQASTSCTILIGSD